MNQPDNRANRQRVAVIGGSVAGIVAAHLLQKTHDVALLKQGDYLGGHAHAILIPDSPFGTELTRSLVQIGFSWSIVLLILFKLSLLTAPENGMATYRCFKHNSILFFLL